MFFADFHDLNNDVENRQTIKVFYQYFFPTIFILQPRLYIKDKIVSVIKVKLVSFVTSI